MDCKLALNSKNKIPPVWAVTHSSSVWQCPDPNATISLTLDKVKDLNSHVP